MLVSCGVSAIKPAPRTSEQFANMMDHVSMNNATLLQYFFRQTRTPNVRDNWVPHTEKCIWSTNCYCGHVRGSRDKQFNPVDQMLERDRTTGGACEKTGGRNKMTRIISRTSCSKAFLNKNCSCWTGRGGPCLHSDMKAPTAVALISIARAAGVDHIIEEGREGGLSAFIYHQHGFRVTSVEYLPEAEPTAVLRQLAPDIAIVDGDGSKLIPEIIGRMSAAEAARTMVIFDGEKRVQAHRTFKQIRDRVAFAAFDDSEVAAFRRYLTTQGEVWFETETYNITRHKRYNGLMNMWRDMPIRFKEGRPGSGIEVQHNCHTTFVRGGGWAETDRTKQVAR
jgi:hypothetical protein